MFEETIQEGMAEAMLERMNLIDDPDLEATRTLVYRVVGSPEAATSMENRRLKNAGDVVLKHAKAFLEKNMLGLEVFQAFLLQSG